MKIYCFALCYNEEVLLPHFLNHYSSFCDKIFIYDDKSTDSSREIIKGYDKAVLIDYPFNDKINDDEFIKVKNECWKQYRNECDYAIVVDIDEFLYHENILKFISDNKQYNVFVPEGYEMVGNKIPDVEPIIYKQFPRGLRNNPYDKACLFNVKEVEEINYAHGCHEAHPKGNIKKLKNNPNLKLLHYKYIDCQYNIDRCAMKRERHSELCKKMGWGGYIYHSEQTMKDIWGHYWENSKEVISEGK